jgi:hypothetical protein
MLIDDQGVVEPAVLPYRRVLPADRRGLCVGNRRLHVVTFRDLEALDAHWSSRYGLPNEGQMRGPEQCYEGDGTRCGKCTGGETQRCGLAPVPEPPDRRSADTLKQVHAS